MVILKFPWVENAYEDMATSNHTVELTLLVDGLCSSHAANKFARASHGGLLRGPAQRERWECCSSEEKLAASASSSADNWSRNGQG